MLALDMLTAKEAHRLAGDKANQLNKQLEPILLSIKYRVDRGEYQCAFHKEYYTFTTEMIIGLTALGYTVVGPDENGFHTVSW